MENKFKVKILSFICDMLMIICCIYFLSYIWLLKKLKKNIIKKLKKLKIHLKLINYIYIYLNFIFYDKLNIKKIIYFSLIFFDN